MILHEASVACLSDTQVIRYPTQGIWILCQNPWLSTAVLASCAGYLPFQCFSMIYKVVGYQMSFSDTFCFCYSFSSPLSLHIPHHLCLNLSFPNVPLHDCEGDRKNVRAGRQEEVC